MYGDQCVVGIGEQQSSAIFLPPSIKDFPQAEPLGRVLFETVLGECYCWLCLMQAPAVSLHTTHKVLVLHKGVAIF